MEINRIECAYCYGRGYQMVHKMVDTEIKDGIASGTIRSEELTCEACGGKGYIEYPVFTVEEAVKIAEHFGFDIKGLEEK